MTSTASSQPTTNANSSNQAALSSNNSSNPALSTINSLLQSIAPVAAVPDQAAPAALNDSSLNDNNPFDVTENRDYVKSSHDVEMRQLIMNVSTLPTSNISFNSGKSLSSLIALKNSLELRNLWVQIYHTSDGLTFQTRSINKFKKINNCIAGIELVEWLIKKKSVSK